MSIRQGNKVIAGHINYHPDLFDHKWADHLLNDVSWLRADTFSWQSGAVYQAAYQHLMDDAGIKYFYVWIDINTGTDRYYTNTETPTVGDKVYFPDNGVMEETSATISAVSGNIITVNGDNYEFDPSSVENKYYPTKTLQSETIAGTTVQFYLADDGHKICPASEESNVVAIYAAIGVAWYYIIDPYYKRFKLPRSKHNKYADTVPVIGTGKALGLTTGVNDGIVYSDMYGSIIQGAGVGENVGRAPTGGMPLTSGAILGVSTDKTKSGIIAQQDQDTDQYKYLYFYVGNFTQTALENTAGLNASLFNNKVDLNAANLSSAGKALIAHLAMPGTHTSLTLGASGTTYTMPADGYLNFVHEGSNGQWLFMSNQDGLEVDGVIYNQGFSRIIMPVSKGDVITVSYSASGNYSRLVFFYANGAS